jgi:hypothetical protein
MDFIAKNGKSAPAMLSNPASADKIIGFGMVGIRHVFPTPGPPYTNSLIALAVAFPVFCKLIILVLSFRVRTIPFAI